MRCSILSTTLAAALTGSLVFASSAAGDIIASQGFDDGPGTYGFTIVDENGPRTFSGDGSFGQTTFNRVASQLGFVPEDGTGFWGIQQRRDEFGGPLSLEFDDLDLRAFENVSLSFARQAGDLVEFPDSMSYRAEYFGDDGTLGGVQTETFSVDRSGEGALRTGGDWVLTSFQVPDATATLRFSLTVSFRGENPDAGGWDSVLVTGDSIPQAVPEPGAAVLIVCVGGAAVLTRRRRAGGGSARVGGAVAP